MLDPVKRAEIDQGRAAMGETLPPLSAELYRRLSEREEFTDAQAFELVKVVVFAMCGGKGVPR